jgi:hypothetical protein
MKILNHIIKRNHITEYKIIHKKPIEPSLFFQQRVNCKNTINVSKLKDNPKLKIRKIHDPFPIQKNKNSKITFNLIDDSPLFAGTKSRAVVQTFLYYIREHRKKYNLSPNEPIHIHGVFAQKGYGQIAMAYGIFKLKKEHIIGHIHTIAFHDDIIPFLQKTCSIGAKLTDNKNNKNKYGHTYYHAYDFPSIWNVFDLIKYKTTNSPSNIFVGMGFDIDEFIHILAHQIETALPEKLRKIKDTPLTFWVATSSGTILRALYKVFPHAFFNGVQTGIKVDEDILDKSRTKIWIHPMKFSKNTDEIPPYDSLLNYDAKVWYFVRRYGKSGDYIWNVAGNL